MPTVVRSIAITWAGFVAVACFPSPLCAEIPEGELTILIAANQKHDAIFLNYSAEFYIEDAFTKDVMTEEQLHMQPERRRDGRVAATITRLRDHALWRDEERYEIDAKTQSLGQCYDCIAGFDGERTVWFAPTTHQARVYDPQNVKEGPVLPIPMDYWFFHPYIGRKLSDCLRDGLEIHGDRLESGDVQLTVGAPGQPLKRRIVLSQELEYAVTQWADINPNQSFLRRCQLWYERRGNALIPIAGTYEQLHQPAPGEEGAVFRTMTFETRSWALGSPPREAFGILLPSRTLVNDYGHAPGIFEVGPDGEMVAVAPKHIQRDVFTDNPYRWRVLAIVSAVVIAVFIWQYRAMRLKRAAKS